MGLFDSIFRPKKDKEAQQALQSAEGFFRTFTGYRPVFTNWKGSIYESELVRAAIEARARHISKLKVDIRGTARPDLQAKLRLGPNQWQTWSQFLARTSTILDVNNTAFIVPVMDEYLVTTGFYTVLPSRCEVVEYKGEPWLRYTFSSGQRAAVELRRCAIMTKYQYDDDFFGSSNAPLDETMQLIHIQNQGIEESAKNSATYRFSARVSNFSTADDLSRERLRFSAENLSADAKSGGILLFPNTYSDIKQLTYSPYTPDADQMRMIRENVADYFGVNDKVMRNEATGDDLDAFFNGAIEVFAIQFSEVMTKAAFTERERALGSEFLATANRLQYMTTSAKVSMAQQLGDRGALLIDEIRELFNYPPLPDGSGQKAPIRGEYSYSTQTEGDDGNAE
ncbi:MAG: phage portal protein [Oscillospiraceae bacterium]|nr:phage portal protein [Oscillospiraceae bacterium]